MKKTDPIEFGKETLLPYAWTQNGRSNKNWTTYTTILSTKKGIYPKHLKLIVGHLHASMNQELISLDASIIIKSFLNNKKVCESQTLG
jgi:hypothetical protein